MLPRPVSAVDLAFMRRIDELHLEFPFAGSRLWRVRAAGNLPANVIERSAHAIITTGTGPGSRLVVMIDAIADTWSRIDAGQLTWPFCLVRHFSGSSNLRQFAVLRSNSKKHRFEFLVVCAGCASFVRGLPNANSASICLCPPWRKVVAIRLERTMRRLPSFARSWHRGHSVTISMRAARCGFTQEAVVTRLHEAFLPLPHTGLRLAGPAHNLIGADTVCAQQHDLCPPDMFMWRVAIPRDRGQTAAINRLESNGNSGSHAPDLHATSRTGIPSRIQMSDLIH
jgi:hypothetical protein